MPFEIKKATKLDTRLRMSLAGVPGAGKTWSSLMIAESLGYGRPCLIDSERGSAKKYGDRFDFDVLELDSHSPETYVEALLYVQSQGYPLIIVDSLSHAWSGREGALEQVDKVAAREALRQGKSAGNNFSAWREVTPMHNKLVDTLLTVRAHLIVTLRSKMGYEMEEGGKKVRKVGMQAIQREGIEYEFDITGDMDLDNTLVISKTRCSALHGKNFPKPGKEIAFIIREWLAGEQAPEIAEAEAMIREMYAGDWETKTRELARYITQGATERLQDLTQQEAAAIIRKLTIRKQQSSSGTSAARPSNPPAPPAKPGGSPPPAAATAGGAPAANGNVRGADRAAELRKEAIAEHAAESQSSDSGIDRPWDAYTTIENLRSAAAEDTAIADSQTRGKGLFALGQLDKERKSIPLFLAFVFRCEASDRMTAGMAVAIRSWCLRSKNGRVQVIAEARTEFASILALIDEEMQTGASDDDASDPGDEDPRTWFDPEAKKQSVVV